MSTSGERCAYFEGSAYLLGLRFFVGRGDGAELSAVATIATVRERFAGRFEGTGDGDPFLVTDLVSEYWNLDSWPLKDADGGVVSVSSGSERSLSRRTRCSDFIERVCRISTLG